MCCSEYKKTLGIVNSDVLIYVLYNYLTIYNRNEIFSMNKYKLLYVDALTRGIKYYQLFYYEIINTLAKILEIILYNLITRLLSQFYNVWYL